VLPLTPEWFIDVTFMVVIIYGVYLGIETIARTGEILFGWAIIVIAIVLFSLLNQLDLHHFEPFLYDGWDRPLKGVYPVLGFPIGEFVFLTMIFPLIRQQDRKKLRRSLKLSAAAITFVSTLITIFLVGVMGVSEASRSPFAVYDMAKNINIEEILVRVEILVAMVWIGTIFMKLALCVYVLTVMTAQMLKLTTYRPLVIPYSFIIVPLALTVYRNAAHTQSFTVEVWTIYSLVHGFLLPSLLLAIAAIRGKKDTSDGSFPPVQNKEKTSWNAGDHAEKEGDQVDKKPAPA
jgi:spore germination protein KB